jgi:hypothetical protein
MTTKGALPVSSFRRPSSASVLLTLGLISKPLLYAAMLFNATIWLHTVSNKLRISVNQKERKENYPINLKKVSAYQESEGYDLSLVT